ncbi:hypothetical protein RBSH_01052 [Rhodopirellula baltica SH28]|uniref:Uncharacterized protein n=1 Tax=Rhodopirellula baltica SH28 TaxID=993517 RepID=K5DMA9_RHOBT|nr:hypothetical protein RBSH_01052 [Rhodopirellula baltica SH28]
MNEELGVRCNAKTLSFAILLAMPRVPREQAFTPTVEPLFRSADDFAS